MAQITGRLSVDRLQDRTDALVQVVSVAGMNIGPLRDGEAVRAPHRHDYHELVWVRSGAGRHLIDGQPRDIAPHTLTLIGRGQVHVFEGACDVAGAVVRFADDLLYVGQLERANPAWLLAGRGGHKLTVPDSEVAGVEAIIAALAAETARPRDGASAELERHLLWVLLLWLERWYDASHIERLGPDDAELALQRRFTRLLERDFASHHDAAHYATALGVPAAALSRTLAHVTGAATKELILDRVMLEAARLLRFTELSVSEVAFRTGFTDPLYFSRAFKRHHGLAPLAFREHGNGVQSTRDARSRDAALA